MGMYIHISITILLFGGGVCDSALKPLIMQQKRTVRIISDAEFREHTDPIFKRLNILKLTDIYKINLLTYVHKTRSHGYFQRNHNVNTRSSNFATPTFHRLHQTQRAVSYAGPNHWNSLPENLKQIDKLSRFKIEVKKFFINNYDD